MLTLDDITAIPLFAGLPASELAQVARQAADIHLAAGEYAVHEGEERALFAVLSGRVEVTKRIDGVERAVGSRPPGAIFGEVPMTLGTAFPAGFRAAEPSRVMRLDARLYYTLAAAWPDLSVQLGELARERIGGLQGLAAKPPAVQATVVGHRWDTASHDLRRFLAR